MQAKRLDQFGGNCVWTLRGGRGVFTLKKFELFFPNVFSHRQRRALQLVLPILGSQGASRPFCNNFNSEIWFKGFNIY